ncbi:hypothetical protein D3C78_367850 [compost metagenome]
MRHQRRQLLQATHVAGGDYHGDDQQGEHQRYRYPRQQVQPLETDQCRDAEAQPEQHHQRHGEALGQPKQLYQHDRHSGRAPRIPAQFGETEQEVRQPAARLAEAEAPHQYSVEPAARSDERQRGGVKGQQRVAEGGDPEHVDEPEGHAQLATGEHRAGEEGETEQDHGDWQKALAGVLRRLAKREFGGGTHCQVLRV